MTQNVNLLTLKDSYNYYCSITVKPVTYSIYYQVCVSLNHKLFEFIQLGEGNNITFDNRLGKLQYFKFKKKAATSKGRILYPINWPETNKLWKENPEFHGEKYVYFIRNWYVGVKWCKVLRNKYSRFYKFVASRTNGTKCKSGNKNKIVSLLKEDSLYYLKFPEYDIQSSKLQRSTK